MTIKHCKARCTTGRIMLCSIVLFAFLIAGCVGAQTKPAQSPTSSSATAQRETPPAKPVKTDLDFFDTSSFDKKLSAALGSNAAEVKLSFPAPVTVNKVPKRVDVWLAHVEKAGGQVELEAEKSPTKRGVESIVLTLAIGAYDMYKKAQLYAPSENYNVNIYYLKGSGAISKMLFLHK